MYDREDFFSPERVDERLELSLLLPVGNDDEQERALTDPNLLLIHDLRYLYGEEGTENVRSLRRVWERLAEQRIGVRQSVEHVFPTGERHLRLLQPQENKAIRTTKPRGRRLANPGAAAIAAVLFLVIMVGSLLAIVRLTRPVQSAGRPIAVGTPAQLTTPTRPTPVPGYPYPTPGQDIARSPASPDSFPALAWSPDGKRLVASTQGRVWLWDLISGSYTSIFTSPTPDEQILALAWSPNGQYLAVGSDLIQVIDPASGRPLWSYSPDYPYLPVPGQPTRTTALAWSPDGNRLAMATQHFDGRCFVNIWNVQSSAPGSSFPDTGCTDGISSISWSSDNRYVATADGQSVRAWDAQSGYGIFQHAISAATEVSWSPSATNAGELAFVDQESSEIWNVWTGQMVSSYPSTPNGVLTWAPDGRYLATASGRTIIICDAQSGQQIYAYTGSAHTIASLAWSPDGSALAAGEGGAGGDHFARVWSA
jgi:WD40 repeat protein